MNDFAIIYGRDYVQKKIGLSLIDFGPSLWNKPKRKPQISGFRSINVVNVSDLSVEDSNTTLIKECSLKEAKEQIAFYFKKNDGHEVSYSELFEELNFDIMLIMDACAELEEEGKIGEAK